MDGEVDEEVEEEVDEEEVDRTGNGVCKQDS